MAKMRDGDEFSKSWETNGKLDTLQTCKSLICQSVFVESVESQDLKRILYDLCSLAINGNLKVDQVSATLIELADMHLEISSLLADLFCAIDVEIMCTENADSRERYANLVIATQAVVPENLLKERLDADTLENMGLIQSKAIFQQKYVKTKTKLYYKQQKFNLLREESEGYAKLITELNLDTTYDVVLQNIKSLIGCFNLDPNRVLDIILESFEYRSDQCSLFVPLLKEYATDIDTLSHVLGFKFHFYQQTEDSITPDSLYHMTALLLQNNLVNMNVLYSHLSPSSSEIVDKFKKELAEAKEYQRKSAIVSLGDKTASTDAKDKEDKDKTVQIPNNQKFGLCEALIKVGAWQQAKCILDAIPPFSAVSHQPIALAVCSLISYVIEPLYTEYSGLSKIIMSKHVIPKKIENVPQAKTYGALLDQAFPMLRNLGPHLAYDPVLLVKINRLAKSFMEKKAQLNMDKDTESSVFAGFLSVYDEVILPSLSLMPNNCCMSEEVWGFIKLLKYEYRYRLYGQWKNESRLTHARLMRAHTDILEKAKYIMKRLSKENIKPLGRQLGKLSHSAPGVVFEYILSQIQKYDNFIGPVVDSLKFLTNMSYDVLLYCVIEALANPEKEKLKTDDTNISFWLQCLANFSGCVLKKYQIDTAGLLQYIANQLKAQKSYDLIILREVIQKMVGIEVSEEITGDHLLAMCGGELLKQEGGYFTQVRNTKKSSSRLMDSLQEHDLSIPMCLLMAQQRQGIVYPQVADSVDDKRHLKLIGKLYDQCQDTLVQFIGFLTLQLSPDELMKRLPNIQELLMKYHIPVEVAFALWRPVYSSSIATILEEFKKADRKDKVSSSSQIGKVHRRYMEAVETVMDPVRMLVKPLIQPKVWEEVSLQFFTTFWSLTMYDLQVPSSAYDKQIQLHKSQAPMEDDKDGIQNKKKKEKERTLVVDKLLDEEKRQQEHVKLVLARLKIEKDGWFPSKSAKHSLVNNIMQFCIFPRLCLTALDAIYCAKFLYIIHSIQTPNFSSLICLDRVFTDITWAMCSCTESEAHRYGRFLCALLEDVMRWHGDKTAFEKECWTAPGFVTVFRAPGTYQNFADQLDYENYRHVVHKWHYSLTRVAVNSLESKDFIQIRNMLIILTKILPHYPRLVKFGQALERRVDRVIEEEKEKRPDVYVLALGYSGQLKNSKKTWVQELDFHKKDYEVRHPPPVAASVPDSSVATKAAVSAPTTSATAAGSTDAIVSHISEKSVSITSTIASKPAVKEAATSKDSKDSTSKTKDKPKTDVERTERDRRSEVYANEKKPNLTEFVKEGKQDEREDKVKLTRDFDEKTKDRGRQSDTDRSEGSERTKNVERDYDQPHSSTSSADGTPGSHHGSDSYRRSGDSSKQPDERDSKRRKVDGTSGSKTSSTNMERERVVTGERNERTITVVYSGSGVKDVIESDRKLSARSEKHDRKRMNDAVERQVAESVDFQEIKRQRSVETSVPSNSKDRNNRNAKEREKDGERSKSNEVELGYGAEELESEKTGRRNESTVTRHPIREDFPTKDKVQVAYNEEGPRERIRFKDDSRERPRTRDEESSLSESRNNSAKVGDDKERRSSEKRVKKSKHR